MITDFIYLKLVFSSCKYTSTFLESYMLYITKLMQTWSLCSPVAMYLWNQMPKQTQNSFNITAALTSQQTLQGIHDILCKCFTYLRGVWAHATCPVNSYRLANTITIYMIASTWSKVHMAGIILRLVAGSMCMWCTVGEPENKAMTDQQGLQCGRGPLEDLQELVAQTCALFFGDRGIHSEQIQPLYKLGKNRRSYTVTYINLAHLLKQSTIL